MQVAKFQQPPGKQQAGEGNHQCRQADDLVEEVGNIGAYLAAKVMNRCRVKIVVEGRVVVVERNQAQQKKDSGGHPDQAGDLFLDMFSEKGFTWFFAHMPSIESGSS